MRAEHVVLVAGNLNNKQGLAVLTSTRQFANMLMKGHIPDTIAPFFCGGRMHAVLKKDGGLRPIAVGNFMR